MMNWKDTTTYRRGDTERKPTTFSVQCGPIQLVVTTGHIYYPGRWVAHAFPIFKDKELKASSLDEAKAEAVEMVRAWIAQTTKCLEA